MSDTNPEQRVDEVAVDTHCHLFLCDREPQLLLEDAGAVGVRTVVCVGIDPETSRRSLELAESFRGVFATAGMHPHTASAMDGVAGASIEELLGNPHVVAVGETGLDFFRMLSPHEDQESNLRLHIAMAREADLPLVVHVRDAWPQILRLLDEGSAERVVIHCFSGDADVARECARRGYHVSFAANITYPKNEHLREAAAAVPLDRLLVETDSPYLAPQRIRGRDNAPANVVDVLEELANVRSGSPGELRAALLANARRAFPRLR
ncbi:MAG TPA: TatD family hydrolase [Actinomycetota bacterium]|nr:TatD family hydrolase [Actinomycetota bacterium]